MSNPIQDSTFQRPPTAQAAVLSQIRKYILEGAWKPGEFINQGNVATRLGVSRVPVREALRTLEADGLVKYEAHRGYTVTSSDLDDLKEIYRIRQLLEREAISDAIPRLNEDILAEMREAMLDLESANPDDIGAMTEANRRFHFSLFEAAGRPRLNHLIRVLWDSSEMYRARCYQDKRALDIVMEEHRQLYEACLLRDGDQIIELSDSHRDHSIEMLEGFLE